MNQDSSEKSLVLLGQVKRIKKPSFKNISLLNLFENIFPENLLFILQNERLDKIKSNEMLKILEILLLNVNQETAIPIWGFLLEISRNQINIPLDKQNEIRNKIESKINELKSFLPENLKNYEFSGVSFQYEHKKRKIPFSMFLTDYLIAFLIKSTTKEIENCVNRYFRSDNLEKVNGINILILNALNSFKEFKEYENNLKNYSLDIFSEEEKKSFKIRQETVKTCSNNMTLLKIIKENEYDMDLFRTLIKYPEVLESFLLFLYINSEKTYKLFLKNLLNDCNAEEQCQILKNFYDIPTEDLHYFNKENISEMIRKKIPNDFLSNKILDLPSEEILELIKENFTFFKNDFEIYKITSRELLQAAEDSDEILEYLFENSQMFGAFIIGSVMRILSTRQMDYIINFFKSRIRKLEKNYYDKKYQKNESTKSDISEETMNKMGENLCEAILIYVKHNNPNKKLMDIFKSEFLIENQRYFFSTMAILDKRMIQRKIMDFFNEETFENFAAVLSPNEMLEELCYAEKVEIKDSNQPLIDRIVDILDIILPKMSESNIVQTLVQASASANFFIVLKKCFEHFPSLKSFTISALKRNTEESAEYVEILEALEYDMVEILALKSVMFISFCMEKSEKIKKVCFEVQKNEFQGVEKIQEALKSLFKE